MVLPGEYPPDIRVRKEARTLLAEGHELLLLCRGDSGQPSRETIDGIDVVRLDTQGLLASTTRFGSAVCNALTTVHPKWLFALDRLVAAHPVDAIHAHDLAFVREALWVGERRDVPVVADLHENFPEAVRQWRQSDQRGRRNPLVRIGQRLMSVSRLKRVERRVLPRTDRVITVCEEAARHYYRDCRVLPNRTTVVGNTVDLDAFDADADPVEGFADEFVLSYVGSFGVHRGLETAIEAVARTDIDEIRLLLVGDGSDRHRDALEQLVADRSVGDRVTFTGWVDFEDVPRYVAASDVCLVPHERTPHTDTTIPHKLFQYMAMSKPVLVTDAPPLKRVVDETEGGVVVPGGDPVAMADAIAALHDDPERASRLGANARRGVETTYNWSRDADRLCDLYRSLECEGHRGDE
jgi:glycosyltransferase involved in cell wall biosynthesis